jgi:hypothetical protein
VRGSNLPRSRQSREATLPPRRSCIHISPKWNLSRMDPLVFGQYADECLYSIKLVMIFGPLEMLSKLQLHLWSTREGG